MYPANALLITNTHPALAFILALGLSVYFALQILLHSTQNKREPRLLECTVPFFDSLIGITRHRANYVAHLRDQYNSSIHTLRMPFQRFYVVHTRQLIQIIQSKAHATTYVPNLLDFGMLFSGLDSRSKSVLGKTFSAHGNAFTMGVHKYLLSGPTLETATRAAVAKLAASLPNGFATNGGAPLLGSVRHELALALTDAVYGPENPYNDPEIEASWNAFVPGISHILYSPYAPLTARNALKARGRVIDAFRKYFETGGHLQAFPMVADMYETNKRSGLPPAEAAKMEIATSLAMLSSGANTAFWFLYQIFSDPSALHSIRYELAELSIRDPTSDGITKRSLIRLDKLKTHCPILIAMFNETLRYHSTVTNIKQVQHDTILADQYLLKKNGIVMIPGRSVHHNKEIWGPSASIFDHHRFLSLSSNSNKNLASTSAFRPFGAGVTMCPGRHFSTNAILSLVAITVVEFDVVPTRGEWRVPWKRNADLWNAMPKPDWDVEVMFIRRGGEGEWRFVWDA
ncbi:cytochrome P450 [Clohesyomyces aquaticus]|uniref:Cytochrome P450 n=1 Tax=Clohesyomyces aquaticus TaxID=1231657 RepID=A0A1Y1ZJ56_9PLEO|nr:cytochrome P450 [Clohesyomyces aquaticus]